MTRAQLVARVQKLIHEPVGGAQFTTAEIIAAINIGYQTLEAKILKCDPQAFMMVDRTGLVALQQYYPTPPGMLYPLELAVLAGAVYIPLTFKAFHMLRESEAASSTIELETEGYYSMVGRYFYLWPAPTATLAAGLQLTHVPALTLSDDTSVPQVQLTWHPAIALNAALYLLGETTDEATPIMAERNLLYSDIDLAYKRNTANEPFSVDFSRSYS